MITKGKSYVNLPTIVEKGEQLGIREKSEKIFQSILKYSF